jgi:outer membrane receptor for ferrienterochelin and colicins
MPLLAGILAALLAHTPPVPSESAGPATASVQTPPAPATQPLPTEPADVPEVKEEVTVSATRTDRRLQDEPLRVEVIDREEIEEKALMTPGSVAMLLGETTGLRVQTVAPSLGAANVRIQGLRGRYAQLLADGLPLYGAGGDSLNLLQVPPLDLGQVEVIKGAASALYGPAALGGIINLVSRRPAAAETEALVNVTSQAGLDGTFWTASAPVDGRGWTLLTGFHGQRRQDLDDDGWSDLPAFARAVVRPRFRIESDTGAALFVTGGAIVEQRDGGTEPGALAPDGAPFAQDLDTFRADAGAVGRWVSGRRLFAARAAYSRNGQRRTFGEVVERGTRQTAFGEGTMTLPAGRHTLVVGAALQQDRFTSRDLPRFDYVFTVPAVFAQDDVTLGSRVAISASARIDVHSDYGTLVSPRISALLKPSAEWTARLSVGGGAFAPTPFTEETDDSGLSQLAPLIGLQAERARTASADVTWARGPFELSATAFGSIVDDAVQLATLARPAVIGAPPFPVGLVNAPEPVRTYGTELLARYRRGRLGLMATHAYTRATELDVDTDQRRDVPLTPRHAASLNAAWEAGWGRAGVEAYYTGRQSLEDDPYLDVSRRYVLFGGLVERRIGRLRLFLNVENLADVRQTKTAPLVLPQRRPDGRWTVDAWAPLDGRTWNGGIRVGL